METGKLLSYPQMSELKAIILVALSMLIMSFGSFIPVLPTILFFALWLSHTYYKKTFIFYPTYSLLPVGIFVSLCVFSTLWSDFQSSTLYFSIMFAAVIACSIVASRIMSLQSFVRGCIIGISIVLIVTLASGKYETVFATGKPALVGFFGQKNMVGSVAAIGFFLSFVSFFYAKTLKEKLFLCLFPMVLAVICLHLSLSKTSLLAALGALGVLSLAYFLSLFPSGLRLIILGLIALLVAGFVLLINGLNIDLYGMVLEALDKNPSLTGRTLVWDNAIERGLERPLIGYGYEGFWRAGQPYADYYLQLYAAEDTAGFHFHNLYLQAFVDLGIFGLFFSLILFVLAFSKSMNWIIRHGMVMHAVFFLGITTLYFIRSLTEVELLGPTGIRVFVFYTFFQKMLEFVNEQDR